MRPLIVRGERTLLIDAGCGDKMDAKSAAIYGLDRTLSPRSRAGRGRRRRRGHRHRRWPATCTSITSAASPSAAPTAAGPALSAGPLRRAPRRVARRHPSARAQPGQLPAGELRAAAGRRRADAGRRRRRDHAGRDRCGGRGGHTMHHQVVMIESGGRDGGLRRRHVPDRGAHPGSVGDGLRPLPDGHAGLQARLRARGHRAAST